VSQQKMYCINQSLHHVTHHVSGSQAARDCLALGTGAVGSQAAAPAATAPAPAAREVHTEVVNHPIPEYHEHESGDDIIEAAYGEGFALGYEGGEREEAAMEEVLQNRALYYAEAKDALTSGQWGDGGGQNEVGDSRADVRVRFDDVNQSASVYYGDAEDPSAVIHYAA